MHHRAWCALGFGLAALAVPGAAAYAALSLTRPRRRPLTLTPAALALAYEDVTFPSRDGLALRGWYLPAQPVEAARSVVIVHGRNGNRADPTIGLVPLARDLVARGYNVLAFDLRGHGESAAGRLAFGHYERHDLLGAVDHLIARGRPGRWVGAVGFSLGASTALLAAADDPRLAAVVADGSFAALRDVLEQHLPTHSHLPPAFTPLMLLLAKWLLGLDVDAVVPERAVPGIAPRPLLIVHGGEDDTVPVAHARRLAAANPHATLWLVAGANHVRAYLTDPQEFLRRVEETFAASNPWRPCLDTPSPRAL